MKRGRLTQPLALAVATVFVALGLLAALVPDIAIAISRKLVSPVGIHVAAAMRCGLGLALLLIAQGSRAPAILRIMGVALIIAGFTFPLLGVENAGARIEWEAGHVPFLRFEGVLFVWAGILIYMLSKSGDVKVPAPDTSLDQTCDR
jgi:hypothetical protein